MHYHNKPIIHINSSLLTLAIDRLCIQQVFYFHLQFTQWHNQCQNVCVVSVLVSVLVSLSIHVRGVEGEGDHW